MLTDMAGWLAGHISWPDDNNVGWTMIMFFVCFIYLFIFVLFYIVSSFFFFFFDSSSFVCSITRRVKYYHSGHLTV